jgi:hypothetical protein
MHWNLFQIVRRSAFAAGLGLAVACCGCGGGEPADPAPVDVEAASKADSTSELKARLNEIATTGSGGSATAGLRPSIEELVKSGDPQKGNELLSDLALLEASQDPEEIKAIAKRMADKL